MRATRADEAKDPVCGHDIGIKGQATDGLACMRGEFKYMKRAEKRHEQSGFTFIELLMVIGITIIIAGLSIPIYGNLQISSQLNENMSQAVQIVRTARERSVARVNNAAHGVYFDINAGDDKIILYQGASYAARDTSYDRPFTLESPLSLSTTLTGDEVNFSKGLGMPDNAGTVTLTHDTSGSRVIDINSFGKVEKN